MSRLESIVFLRLRTKKEKLFIPKFDEKTLGKKVFYFLCGKHILICSLQKPNISSLAKKTQLKKNEISCPGQLRCYSEGGG